MNTNFTCIVTYCCESELLQISIKNTSPRRRESILGTILACSEVADCNTNDLRDTLTDSKRAFILYNCISNVKLINHYFNYFWL